MDQGVPGFQNEPFFELLHPNAARGPPPPPPPPPPPLSASSSSSADDAADELAAEDPSLHEIAPSYEFHLTHSSKSSEPTKSELAKSDDVGANVEDPPPFLYRGSSFASSGGDHKQGSTNETAQGLDRGKFTEVAADTCNEVTMAAIDHTMKTYTDNLLHVLQIVSERLSQLENTVQGLEHTVAELKSAEGEKHDQSNGRLMKLELLVEEVHAGMQLLHDKSKLEESKSHLTNVYLDDQKSTMGSSADTWHQPRLVKEEGPHVAYSEPPPQLAPPQYAPQAQLHYPTPPPPPQLQAYVSSQNMLPSPPSNMNGPSNPPATAQPPYLPTAQHLPAQPSVQQVSPPPPPPPQHSMQITSYQTQPPQQVPQSTYNLPLETVNYGHVQPQHHHPAPPTPPSSTYLPEPQQYSAGMHGGPPRQHPQEINYPPPQQHNPVGSQHMYEPNPGRTSMAPPYAQPQLSKPAPPVPMYDAASGGGYGTAPYRTGQPVPSAPSGGGGGSGGYPRLPTAQPLQHGLPAASGVSSGPSTRSPLDDVIDKVVAMGFSREQVRGVVRQLTENGQSVDMNVVLDKLMNGGGDVSQQPPRGWFGRR